MNHQLTLLLPKDAYVSVLPLVIGGFCLIVGGVKDYRIYINEKQ